MEAVTTRSTSEWFSELGLEDERAYLSHFEHDGIKLVRTCFACPEAYDAFDASGANVGSFRLRHGQFTVRAGEKTIHTDMPEGDGVFASDEREKHLLAGIEALKRFLMS